MFATVSECDVSVCQKYACNKRCEPPVCMVQGLHEVSSAAAELEEGNALALAIVAPGNRQASELLQFSVHARCPMDSDQLYS